jgi:outer membrane protein
MKKIVFGFLIYSCTAVGQDSITLQSCLDKAQSNTKLYANEISTTRSAEVERRFHSWSLLPNLSASTDFDVSFGRRLDPFTNTFATTSVNSHSLGLNSSMELFNGLSYVYKRNQFEASIRKGEISFDSKQNELKIQVIEVYIELCKLIKQKEFAEVRIEKYKQIQMIQGLLIQEGKINSVDTLKSHNSLLIEQALLFNMLSDIRLKSIELNYLIGEPLHNEHSFDLTSISQITSKPKLVEDFTLMQLIIDQSIAENQLNIDRSAILPSLSLSALLGTGFSTNNKDYLTTGEPTIRYNNQISQNLYEGIGLQLSIPIFSRGQWLKAKELYSIQMDEFENTKGITAVLLEKRKLELAQNRLKLKAEQELNKHIADNLQTIYEKTVLLYEEGRINYTELETSFIDWQNKLIDVESLKLDSELLKLYE